MQGHAFPPHHTVKSNLMKMLDEQDRLPAGHEAYLKRKAAAAGAPRRMSRLPQCRSRCSNWHASSATPTVSATCTPKSQQLNHVATPLRKQQDVVNGCCEGNVYAPCSHVLQKHWHGHEHIAS